MSARSKASWHWKLIRVLLAAAGGAPGCIDRNGECTCLARLDEALSALRGKARSAVVGKVQKSESAPQGEKATR